MIKNFEHWLNESSSYPITFYMETAHGDTVEISSVLAEDNSILLGTIIDKKFGSKSTGMWSSKSGDNEMGAAPMMDLTLDTSLLAIPEQKFMIDVKNYAVKIHKEKWPMSTLSLRRILVGFIHECLLGKSKVPAEILDRYKHYKTSTKFGI